MNYFLTEEQEMIRELAAKIAKEKVAPLALEYDEKGTFPWDIVELLAKLEATKVIAGGSIAEAIEALGLTDKMTHVSTGGGAALRLFEGIPLPAVEALPDK